MIKLRQISYACRDYETDPADYGYLSHPEILALANNNPKDLPLTTVVELCDATSKQFSVESLRQLVAARGFLAVFCNWLEPGQVEDESIRGSTAIIQHLLSDIWEKLNG